MLPDKLETIEGSAFMECTELKKLDIPDTVTYIGDDAFGFCINLEHILLPSKINKISKELFISCYKLKDFACGGGFFVVSLRAIFCQFI